MTTDRTPYSVDRCLTDDEMVQIQEDIIKDDELAQMGLHLKSCSDCWNRYSMIIGEVVDAAIRLDRKAKVRYEDPS